MGLFGPKVGQGALFDEVCQYHITDKKVRMLLQAVIKKYQPPRPVEIFIAPELMLKALSDAEFADQNAALQKLYNNWFE
jgi:hypothetical protein